MVQDIQKATFATGCFWCAEAAYKLLKGVISATSGYARLRKASAGQAGPEDITEHRAPTYEEVSSGRTPYVEAVQIEYDASEVAYDDLLKIFWEIHNPTEQNRQGPDVGPQYQAAIFYHTEEQRELALKSKEQIEKEKHLEDKVMTLLKPFESFYPAEAYHKDFYERNPSQPYSQDIIAPKVEKVKTLFHEKLKATNT